MDAVFNASCIEIERRESFYAEMQIFTFKVFVLPRSNVRRTVLTFCGSAAERMVSFSRTALLTHLRRKCAGSSNFQYCI
jgi:hypothetical protein